MLPERYEERYFDTPELWMPRFRSPVCDVCVKDGKVQATIEVPGVDKKDIDLDVTDSEIRVRSEKKSEEEEEDEGEYSYSSTSQSYYRRIPLPEEIDSQKATATYKNGVLNIEAPVKKGGTTKKIEIR